MAVVESKRTTAAILALLLGGLGVHKFYLGKTQPGIIQIISNVACFAGALIGLIEGIKYLNMKDEAFLETYQLGNKNWF